MNADFLPDRVWWPVDPREHESLLGWAVNTMDDNVLPHLPSVLRDAGQTYRNRTVDIVRGEADPRAIAAVLGRPIEEVDARLEKAMKRAYREVTEVARQKKCSLRVAAYAVALQRISAVYGEREIFP